MAAISAACRDANLDARVSAVISDRADAPGLGIAAREGLPTAVVPPRDFPDRAVWDDALARTVAAFTPDLVVLAGFMRIVGSPLLDAFPGRIINTHPSLLPAFPGASAVAEALAAGVSETGCSVIVVDEGVDTGPILAQCAVPVREDDSVDSLHERIKETERVLVVDTLRDMIAAGWTARGEHHSLSLGKEGLKP